MRRPEPEGLLLTAYVERQSSLRPWVGGAGLLLQASASKRKRNDNTATNSQGFFSKGLTPHTLGVHAPLTPR